MSVCKRMTRVLLYPNLTFKDLERDSYIDLIRTQIKQLNVLSPNYWFYALLPRPLDLGPNVTYLEYHLPTHAPTMRVHFDTTAFKKAIAGVTIDVVYSHSPEHTHALNSVLLNTCNFTPKIVGYCHWFDFPYIVSWNKGSLETNLIGLLNMEKCFVNTVANKTQAIEIAKTILAIPKVAEITSKLMILHPPNGAPITNKIEPYKKIIVFNHRAMKAKSFDVFLKTMDELWLQRQDFRVWLTMTEGIDKPYAFVRRFDSKDDYYKHLSRCVVGYAPKQHSGWSMATVDGLSRGCPYIMYDSEYYKDIQNDADYFTTIHDALYLLNQYLDNPQHRHKMALRAVAAAKRIDDSIEPLHRQLILAATHKLRDTPATTKLISIIENAGTITETDLLKGMGWGKTMPFTKYRSTLLSHKHIGEVRNAEATYVWRK